MSNFYTLTTSFGNGLTNADPWQTMGTAGTPDPTWSQMFVDDFNDYIAARYTLSGVGTPAAALVATQGPGGILQLSTSAATNDTSVLQLAVAPVLVSGSQLGKPFFWKARISLGSGVASTVAAGMMSTNANPVLNNVDGLYFLKASGGQTWTFQVVVSGVTVSTPIPTSLVSVDATYVELGFALDYQGNVAIFFNPTTGNQTVAAQNGAPRGRVAAVYAPSLPAGQLNPTISLSSTSAAVKSAFVDYQMFSAER